MTFRPATEPRPVPFPRWLVLTPNEPHEKLAVLTGKLKRRQAGNMAKTIATAAGEQVIMVEERRGASNPTLYAHGAPAATYHIVFEDGAPLADIYTLVNAGDIRRIAEDLATVVDSPVRIYNNELQPDYLDQHPTTTATPRRRNPAGAPARGEVWTTLAGGRCRVLEVAGGRVQVLHLETGSREWIGLHEFLATYRVPRTRRNPMGRKSSRRKRNPGGPGGSLYDDAVMAGLEMDSHESDLYLRDTPEARRLAALYGKTFTTFISNVDGKRWLDVPFAYLPWWRRRERNPSRSKAARSRRQLARLKTLKPRRLYRAEAAGRRARGGYLLSDFVTRQMARGDRPSGRPNPKGRKQSRRNPRRRAAYLGAGSNAFGRKEWDRLTLNEATAVLKDIAEIADDKTFSEKYGELDDGRAARDLRRRIGGAANLKSYAQSLVAGNRHLDPRTPNPKGRITAESWRNLSDYEVDQVAHHGHLKRTRDLAKRELKRRGVKWSGEGVADRAMGREPSHRNPARREIPPGKNLIAEYGSFPPEDRAEVTKLAEGFGPAVRADVALVEVSPGFELAGSAARWTNGYFAVWWFSHGARQGRQYKTLAEARAHFDKLVPARNPMGRESSRRNPYKSGFLARLKYDVATGGHELKAGEVVRVTMIPEGQNDYAYATLEAQPHVHPLAIPLAALGPWDFAKISPPASVHRLRRVKTLRKRAGRRKRNPRVTAEMVEAVRDQLDDSEAQRWKAEGYTHERDPVTAKERRDFYVLDIGSSGAFMVRKADGAVFGIKGYGTPDYRKGIGFLPDLTGYEIAKWRFARGPFRTDMRQPIPNPGRRVRSLSPLAVKLARRHGPSKADIAGRARVLLEAWLRGATQAGHAPSRADIAAVHRASLAQAEREGRSPNPRGRKSSRDEMARARRTAQMWNEFPATTATRMRIRSRTIPRTLVKLGDVHSIVYRSNKYDGKHKLHEHRFKRPLPVLTSDPDGRAAHLVGGGYRITGDGLVD